MPPLQCPACVKNNTFVIEEYLERHLCEHHFECRPYVCDDCDGRYSTQGALTEHCVSGHGKEKFKVRYAPTEKDLNGLFKVASQMKIAKELAAASATADASNDALLIINSSITCDSAGPVEAAPIPTSGSDDGSGLNGGVSIKRELDDYSQFEFSTTEPTSAIADELPPLPQSMSPPPSTEQRPQQPQSVRTRVRNEVLAYNAALLNGGSTITTHSGVVASPTTMLLPLSRRRNNGPPAMGAAEAMPSPLSPRTPQPPQQHQGGRRPQAVNVANRDMGQRLLRLNGGERGGGEEGMRGATSLGNSTDKYSAEDGAGAAARNTGKDNATPTFPVSKQKELAERERLHANVVRMSRLISPPPPLLRRMDPPRRKRRGGIGLKKAKLGEMGKLKCRECGKLVPNLFGSLANHVNKHLKKTLRRCKVCWRASDSFVSNSLNCHMGQAHADVRDKNLYIEVNQEAIEEVKRKVPSYFPTFVASKAPLAAVSLGTGLEETEHEYEDCED